MGHVGYILGYIIVGAFLLGVIVGYFISEHKEK